MDGMYILLSTQKRTRELSCRLLGVADGGLMRVAEAQV